MTTVYIRNKSCPCVRCRAHSLMGAAVLITLGVLFLLESYPIALLVRTFPFLCRVMGCVLLVSPTESREGHVNPGWNAALTPPPQPPAPQQGTSTQVPPPPPPQDDIDSQVKP